MKNSLVREVFRFC